MGLIGTWVVGTLGSNASHCVVKCSLSCCVKVYYKRGDVPGLDEQERRLADIRYLAAF